VTTADVADVAPRRIPDGPVVQDTFVVHESAEYGRQQACYICKVRFSDRHHFYSHLCPSCAALNFRKRHQQCDLSGRVALVTGARVKIGFQTTLKLLRMGARVIATTRFPQDAVARYRSEPDSADWLQRLEIRGMDFRFLGAVERFCSELETQESWLDIIVNNACQTVRRPAGYYQHLVDGEAAAAKAIATGSVHTTEAVESAALAECPQHAEDSVAMSQLSVLAEDRMSAESSALVLPKGERDVHGQQLDLRTRNSWLLKLGEVATPEAVEVFCINALAPFVLNGRLRSLLEKSPYPDRYIINVSAMEGKFYRYKQPTHPHTNMAKAALNMMTRTSAEDYAKPSGIYMNSVDTGWINDENPLPTAQRIAADHGFQTPIDEIDAAARILDPVVAPLAARAARATQAGASDTTEVASDRKPRRGAAGSGGGGGSGGEISTAAGAAAAGDDVEPA